jgi:uncharacterized membrane protein YkoI
MSFVGFSRVIVTVCVFAMSVAHAQSADETLKGLPAAVQKTIRAERGTRGLMKIESKAKAGETIYKIVMGASDGMQKRLTVDASGKLLRVKNDVTRDSLPAPVRALVDANSKSGKFVRSTKIDHDAKVDYEAEFDVSGRSKVFLLDPAGKTKKVEEVVAISTVPAPVRSAVEKEVGSGKLIKVKTITEPEKPALYEAQWETGAKKSEIKLAADGKVLERE